MIGRNKKIKRQKNLSSVNGASCREVDLEVREVREVEKREGVRERTIGEKSPIAQQKNNNL